MSEASWVYGCIIYRGAPATVRQYCELNKDAIENLPDTIDRKSNLLTKNMFTVPMPQEDGFYRYQMIHFAASYNYLDAYWQTWFNNFEALLRTLYWSEANVHVKIYGLDEQNLYWKADMSPIHEDPPQPIKEWELQSLPYSAASDPWITDPDVMKKLRDR
jgi:hypothetical protein